MLGLDLDYWKKFRDKKENQMFKDNKGKVQIIVNREDSQGGKPIARVWVGRASLPKYNYYFKTVEEREKYIERFVTEHINYINDKNNRKDQEKELRNAHKMATKVGDIFRASYGYSMVLNSFYQVVEVKNKTVKLRELNMSFQPLCFMQWNVAPIKNDFANDKIITKVVKYDVYSKKEYVSTNYDKRSYNVTEEVNNNETWLEDQCD